MDVSDAAAARHAALADIAGDPRLSAVLAYWQRQSTAEGAPPRPRDIDPVALPPSVLPYLTLLDVIDGGETFRVRLVGSATVSAVGRDFTGKRLEEAMSGDVLTAALQRYRTAVASRRPILAYADYRMPDGSILMNLLMTLPLSSDGVVVDRLLGVFGPKSERLAQQALRNFYTVFYPKPVRSYVVI